jgi:hypothetical protein
MSVGSIQLLLIREEASKDEDTVVELKWLCARDLGMQEAVMPGQTPGHRSGKQGRQIAAHGEGD